MFCFTAFQRFLLLKVLSTSGEAVTDVRVRLLGVGVVTISILALLAVRILFVSWLILAFCTHFTSQSEQLLLLSWQPLYRLI